MPSESQLLRLQSQLEWAGGRLIAMPGQRIGPADPRALWPDYSQDRFQLLEHRIGLRLRALAPTPEEIELMDDILYLIVLVEKREDKRRVILQKRSLIHPLTLRHLHPWTRIAKDLHTSPWKVQSLHAKALWELHTKVPNAKLDQIDQRFDEVVLSRV